MGGPTSPRIADPIHPIGLRGTHDFAFPTSSPGDAACGDTQGHTLRARTQHEAPPPGPSSARPSQRLPLGASCGCWQGFRQEHSGQHPREAFPHFQTQAASVPPGWSQAAATNSPLSQALHSPAVHADHLSSVLLKTEHFGPLQGVCTTQSIRLAYQPLVRTCLDFDGKQN